jgi:hypothetical protein
MTSQDRDTRDAALASVLAQAVREAKVPATVALRVIKHEMRRRNTNKKSRLPYRSTAAQRVIDDYAGRGEPVPKNGSNDALHADHVYELAEADLHQTVSVEDWKLLLTKARTVVVVTAAENYALEAVERSGTRGPDKYAIAEVSWSGQAPPFAAATDAPNS